jgi:AcrR family transcriptional regulator
MSQSKPTQSERIKAASRQRRERQKAETRQAIIGAATELFISEGYANFSLRQVAVQIGYSPGTIYLYFEDKDDLLFTLADEGFQRFGAMLQAAVDATDDIQGQIRGMGLAYIEFGLNNPVHYRLMFMERTDFMLREHTDADRDTWYETFLILYRTVEKGIEAGVVCCEGNAEATSDALWAMLHGVVALAVAMPHTGTERIHRASQEIKRAIEAGFFVAPA